MLTLFFCRHFSQLGTVAQLIAKAFRNIARITDPAPGGVSIYRQSDEYLIGRNDIVVVESVHPREYHSLPFSLVPSNC